MVLPTLTSHTCYKAPLSADPAWKREPSRLWRDGGPPIRANRVDSCSALRQLRVPLHSCGDTRPSCRTRRFTCDVLCGEDSQFLGLGWTSRRRSCEARCSCPCRGCWQSCGEWRITIRSSDRGGLCRRRPRAARSVHEDSVEAPRLWQHCCWGSRRARERSLLFHQVDELRRLTRGCCPWTCRGRKHCGSGACSSSSTSEELRVCRSLQCRWGLLAARLARCRGEHRPQAAPPHRKGPHRGSWRQGYRWPRRTCGRPSLYKPGPRRLQVQGRLHAPGRRAEDLVRPRHL
mmetsp:Transcript_112008/g.198422  ORF Transcript_112008/g.198422 Transcript_112008/m.198422 type:complete len:289 (-) Transcript_112008:358-1224(-)